jgi:hypothetical protein
VKFYPDHCDHCYSTQYHMDLMYCCQLNCVLYFSQVYGLLRAEQLLSKMSQALAFDDIRHDKMSYF